MKYDKIEGVISIENSFKSLMSLESENFNSEQFYLYPIHFYLHFIREMGENMMCVCDMGCIKK